MIRSSKDWWVSAVSKQKYFYCFHIHSQWGTANSNSSRSPSRYVFRSDSFLSPKRWNAVWTYSTIFPESKKSRRPTLYSYQIPSSFLCLSKAPKASECSSSNDLNCSAKPYGQYKAGWC